MYVETIDVLQSIPLHQYMENDDYEGAEFYCRVKEIPLKTGDILLFPSN